MTTPKPSPSDLSAEERAIVDKIAFNYVDSTPECAPTPSWEDGYAVAMPLAVHCILARRAFFASPATSEPEKVVCPNCGREVKSLFAHYDNGIPAGCNFPEPAKVEPAPVAASEMPYALLDAKNSLLACAVDAKFPAILVERAGAIVSWWREHVKQPVVGMTPELESVLRSAKEYEMAVRAGARVEWQEGEADRIGAAIAAVLAQATHPAANRELVKVRLALDTMRALTEPNCQGFGGHAVPYRFCMEALAEIDAAEGKGGE